MSFVASLMMGIVAGWLSISGGLVIYKIANHHLPDSLTKIALACGTSAFLAAVLALVIQAL